MKPKGYGFTVDDIDWMPPVRGRELKHSVFQEDKVMYRDAPCAGARIETILEGMKIPCHLDAPCAGARIETSKSTKNLTGANKMPPVWSLVEDFW